MNIIIDSIVRKEKLFEFRKSDKRKKKKINLSQEDISKEIFVSRQTISNWETGKSYPDIQNLLILSELFDCSLDELVKGDLKVMERKVAEVSMSKYTKIMVIFIALAALSIGPSLYYLDGYLSFIPPLILWLVGMYGAMKLEKIKKIKKNVNIKNYKEIMAYMESKDINAVKRSKNTRKHKMVETLILISFCTLFILLTIISIFLFRI